jgi:hypothetical protein
MVNDDIQRMFPEDADDGGPVNVHALQPGQLPEHFIPHDQSAQKANETKHLPGDKLQLLDALRDDEFRGSIFSKLCDSQAWEEVQAVYLELGMQKVSMEEQLERRAGEKGSLWYRQCQFQVRMVHRIRSDLSYLMDKAAARLGTKRKAMAQAVKAAEEQVKEASTAQAVPGEPDDKVIAERIKLQRSRLEHARKEFALQESKLRQAEAAHRLEEAKLKHAENQAALEAARIEIKKGDMARKLVMLNDEKDKLRTAFKELYGKDAWILLLVQAGLFAGCTEEALKAFSPAVQEVLRAKNLVNG